MNAVKLSPTVNGAEKAIMASHLRLLQMARSRSSPAPFRGMLTMSRTSLGHQDDIAVAEVEALGFATGGDQPRGLHVVEQGREKTSADFLRAGSEPMNRAW